MKVVVGSVIAALGASACCLGPVVFSILGAGALSVASTKLEPLRPLFVGLTAVLLSAAFVVTYRRTPAEACAPGETCPPAGNRAAKIILWVATIVALLLVTFPYYIDWVV